MCVCVCVCLCVFLVQRFYRFFFFFPFSFLFAGLVAFLMEDDPTTSTAALCSTLIARCDDMSDDVSQLYKAGEKTQEKKKHISSVEFIYLFYLLFFNFFSFFF